MGKKVYDFLIKALNAALKAHKQARRQAIARGAALVDPSPEPHEGKVPRSATPPELAAVLWDVLSRLQQEQLVDLDAGLWPGGTMLADRASAALHARLFAEPSRAAGADGAAAPGGAAEPAPGGGPSSLKAIDAQHKRLAEETRRLILEGMMVRANVAQAVLQPPRRTASTKTRTARPASAARAPAQRAPKPGAAEELLVQLLRSAIAKRTVRAGALQHVCGHLARAAACHLSNHLYLRQALGGQAPAQPLHAMELLEEHRKLAQADVALLQQQQREQQQQAELVPGGASSPEGARRLDALASLFAAQSLTHAVARAMRTPKPWPAIPLTAAAKGRLKLVAGGLDALGGQFGGHAGQEPAERLPPPSAFASCLSVAAEHLRSQANYLKDHVAKLEAALSRAEQISDGLQPAQDNDPNIAEGGGGAGGGGGGGGAGGRGGRAEGSGGAGGGGDAAEGGAEGGGVSDGDVSDGGGGGAEGGDAPEGGNASEGGGVAKRRAATGLATRRHQLSKAEVKSLRDEISRSRAVHKRLAEEDADQHERAAKYFAGGCHSGDIREIENALQLGLHYIEPLATAAAHQHGINPDLGRRRRAPAAAAGAGTELPIIRQHPASRADNPLGLLRLVVPWILHLIGRLIKMATTEKPEHVTPLLYNCSWYLQMLDYNMWQGLNVLQGNRQLIWGIDPGYKHMLECISWSGHVLTVPAGQYRSQVR